MKLEEKDIEKIAVLSRLELSGDERSRLAHDVNEILSYVSQLSEVDTEGAEPFFESIPDANELRQDQVSRIGGSEARKMFLKNAPEKTEEYVRVKSVF